MEWLNNAWVVGIGTGAISGLFVAWITSRLFSGASLKEHNSRLAAANREIVLALRSGIPEGAVPSVNVVEALIEATARRFGVRPSELYGPQELGADLIKEVMDSSFISAQTKQGYCEQLLTLKSTKEPSLPALTNHDRDGPTNAMVLAGILGLVTFGMTAFTYVAFRVGEIAGNWSWLQTLSVPGLIAVASAVIATLVTSAAAAWRRSQEVKKDQAVIDEMVSKMTTTRKVLAEANEQWEKAKLPKSGAE